MKKGISIIIALLLLIILTVASSVILYSFMVGFVGQPGFQKSSAQAQVNIAIEEVYYDSARNLLSVYVRNLGVSSATIDRIHVYKGGVSLLEELEVSAYIAPGELCEVTGALSASLQAGKYSVKVISMEGAQAVAFFYPKG